MTFISGFKEPARMNGHAPLGVDTAGFQKRSLYSARCCKPETWSFNADMIFCKVISHGT
jgi:hypothetical protein